MKMPIFDVQKNELEQWNAYTPDEKKIWTEFFGLRPVPVGLHNNYKPYAHDYAYQLTDADVARIIFCAVAGILKYNIENQMARMFLGNSGGLDSACTCALSALAVKMGRTLDHNFELISYGLPIESNPEHGSRSAETAAAFGVRHIEIQNLDSVFAELKKTLTPLTREFNFNDAEKARGFGNTKARIRMIVNFFASTKSGGYVLSTDNLSELYMAFWTLMGDVGAFGPIQNILKGLELPEVAFAIGVPDRTIGAKPTDGLNVHKSLDEDEGGDADAFHGVQYPHLDAIICHAVAAGFSLEKVFAPQVEAKKIHSEKATQENIDFILSQMSSPASVWKRTRGSIGISITRAELGLPPLEYIAAKIA